MKYFSYILLPILILLALGLRVYKLTNRPMHTDEAVQAAKFGALLEKGDYRYDPFEYHGPSLNYITLVPAWLSGTKTYVEVSESLLRSVPVFFGMSLILLAMGFFRKESPWRSFLAILLVAISPAMVFYSRYYIHELILVFFTYLSIFSFYKWIESNKIQWSVIFGLSIGMMVITKETWVLSIGAMMLSYVLLNRGMTTRLLPTMKQWLVGGGVMLIIIVLFFSSFFSNPHGLIDMVLTYSTYLNRAGTNDLHLQSWYYYPMLLIYQAGNGHTWSELPVLLFAAAGYFFLFRREPDDKRAPNSLRFIGVFCLILLIIYSVLPYKTPWNLLNFYYGMILIAGYGAWKLLDILNPWIAKWLVAACLVLSSYFLLAQDIEMYHEPAAPSNPYVYGHTSGDFTSVIATIDSVALDVNTYIEVIFPGHDYWPFPWYLRKYQQVAYRGQVDFEAPSGEIIIISPSLEGQLVEKIYERPQPGERNLYMSLFEEARELRPGIFFYGYMQQELWIRNQNKIDQPAEP